MTDPLVGLFNLKGIIHLNERELTLASDGKNTVLFSDKLTYPWLSKTPIALFLSRLSIEEVKKRIR